MKKLYQVEALVKDMLVEYPETRNNDTLLQKMVMVKINPEITSLGFCYVIMLIKKI